MEPLTSLRNVNVEKQSTQLIMLVVSFAEVHPTHLFKLIIHIIHVHIMVQGYSLYS